MSPYFDIGKPNRRDDLTLYVQLDFEMLQTWDYFNIFLTVCIRLRGPFTFLGTHPDNSLRGRTIAFLCGGWEETKKGG